jgi:hypothetical protein
MKKRIILKCPKCNNELIVTSIYEARETLRLENNLILAESVECNADEFNVCSLDWKRYIIYCTKCEYIATTTNDCLEVLYEDI